MASVCSTGPDPRRLHKWASAHNTPFAEDPLAKCGVDDVICGHEGLRYAVPFPAQDTGPGSANVRLLCCLCFLLVASLLLLLPLSLGKWCYYSGVLLNLQERVVLPHFGSLRRCAFKLFEYSPRTQSHSRNARTSLGK